MDDPLSGLYRWIEEASPLADRPFLTLTYAQGLDGSIAAEPGRQTILSGPESLQMTHTLRGLHDGILVGIGTVLADDPRLTVRHARGDHPRPIILDSQLRFPSDAQMARAEPLPWILCREGREVAPGHPLQDMNLDVIPVPANGKGLLDGISFLKLLRGRGLQRVMIEGGARVISYFLRERLVDLLVLTVTPVLLAGTPAIHERDGAIPPLKISNPRWHQAGADMIVWGALRERAE